MHGGGSWRQGVGSPHAWALGCGDEYDGIGSNLAIMECQ